MKIPFIKTLEDVDKLLKFMNRVHGVLVLASMGAFLVALLLGYPPPVLLACFFALAVFGSLFMSTNSLRMALIGIQHRK